MADRPAQPEAAEAGKSRQPKRVKTPMLLQMEAVECGAAALGIVLGYHGRHVPLEQLRTECGVSRDGSKASNVVKAARQYGMKAKGFKKGVDALKEIKPPFIVFWNFNHFLVVEGFGEGVVYVNDPAFGHRKVTDDEFDESYTGVTLVMEPGDGFERGGKRSSMRTAIVERLRSVVRPLAYSFGAGLLLVLPGVAVPIISQLYVDSVLIEQRSDWLRPILAVLAVVLLLMIGLRYLQLGVLRRLKVKLSAGMSSRFMWHMLNLPVGYFAQRYAGELAARVQLNDQIAEFIAGRLAASLIDLVMLIFYFIVMLTYDPLLTSVAVLFAVASVWIMFRVARLRVEANARQLQTYGNAHGVAVAGLTSMDTIKASALESGFFMRWAGHYATAVNARQDLALTHQLVGILPPLLTSLGTTLVLVVGGFEIMDGALTIGMLIAFQSLMASFMDPVESLLNMSSEFQELGGDLARVEDVLRHRRHGEGRERAEEADRSGKPFLDGFVELDKVTFGYSRVAPPLINGLDLMLRPGDWVALVGGSGSGKSTVARLMAGLYEPWDGQIRFDGLERTEIPRATLNRSIGVVEQEIFIFAGTVRENLSLWDETISDRELWDACRSAEIEEVIRALPGGLDAELLEGGANLSGGQRQRLELARALVSDPSILLLDEATSALDSATERRIMLLLRRRGCTCVIVAHRLSTIRDCDEILVLDDGRVLERGSHEQLWNAGGAYARLLRSDGVLEG